MDTVLLEGDPTKTGKVLSPSEGFHQSIRENRHGIAYLQHDLNHLVKKGVSVCTILKVHPLELFT